MWSERSWLFSFIMWVVWFVVMKGLIVMDGYIHGMVKVKRAFNAVSVGFGCLPRFVLWYYMWYRIISNISRSGKGAQPLRLMFKIMR
jgi:hypothetical protein